MIEYDYDTLHGYAEMNGKLVAEIEALRAENARLREALNPFAVVAEMTIGESEDDRDLFRPARNGPRLIVADFRKARAAMGESDD